MTDIRLPGIDKDFPDWTSLQEVRYEDSFWDNEDISNYNSTLIKTGLNLKEINKQLNIFEKLRLQKEIEYKRKFRNELLNATARTESQKRILAEIECEDIESELAYYDSIVKELNRLSLALRTDLDILKTIGFNLRQEMKI